MSTISKMETTQTAVEWLFEQIGNGNITSEKTDCGYLITINNDCYEQAKQMEKQQLANTWDAACDSYILLEGNLVKVWKDFDKYYNDNYGSNNQI